MGTAQVEHGQLQDEQAEAERPQPVDRREDCGRGCAAAAGEHRRLAGRRIERCGLGTCRTSEYSRWSWRWSGHELGVGAPTSGSLAMGHADSQPISTGLTKRTGFTASVHACAGARPRHREGPQPRQARNRCALLHFPSLYPRTDLENLAQPNPGRLRARLSSASTSRVAAVAVSSTTRPRSCTSCSLRARRRRSAGGSGRRTSGGRACGACASAMAPASASRDPSSTLRSVDGDGDCEAD